MDWGVVGHMVGPSDLVGGRLVGYMVGPSDFMGWHIVSDMVMAWSYMVACPSLCPRFSSVVAMVGCRPVVASGVLSVMLGLS